MEINIQGLVKNSKSMLKKHGILLPLYEAMVNSIHAIDEIKEIDSNYRGNITIEFLRNPKLEGVKIIPSLKNIIIKDNGIGFNDANMKSFETSYSQYKQKIGGKGLGRFSYLVTFKKVSVKSVFKINDTFYNRKFDFINSMKGVENNIFDKTEEDRTYSILELNDFQSSLFKDNDFHKKPLTIARRLMQHCALLFVLGKAPNITLIDSGVADNNINLNTLWEEEVKSELKIEKFTIGEEEFTLNLLYIYNTDDNIHNELKLCADNREVVSRRLSDFLEFLPKNKKLDPFHDDRNTKMVISAYITGDYLNKNLNPTRDGFDFDDLENLGEENIYSHEIGQNDIFTEAANKINLMLAHKFEEIKRINYESNLNFIERYPAYYIFKNNKEELENISSLLSDSEKETVFRKMRSNFESQLNIMYNNFFSKGLNDETNLETFRERTKEIVSKINDVNKSTLAEYVAHRKMLLDLLEVNLDYVYDPIKNKEKHKLEKNIHELIMPMNTNSNEVRFEDHNLWVIEETLAFHNYLSSDEQINKIPLINSDSKDKMDICVFQTGYLTSSSLLPTDIESITIIEFKRPGRNNYVKGDPEKDPHEQAIKYLRYIRSNGLKTVNGRKISGEKVSKIPIYIYIIADIEESLKDIIEGNGYDPASDADHGAYYYHPIYHAYFEIVSYEKLIKRAKRRNQAFFDKTR